MILFNKSITCQLPKKVFFGFFPHSQALLGEVDRGCLFCHDPRLRFEYRDHEQIVPALLRQGRAAEAEQLWRDAVAERPDFVPAWLALAEVYLSVGRESELMADVAYLQSTTGTREAACVVRARLHLARREFVAARALLEEAARSFSPGLWARWLLGQTLAQEGRDRTAAVRVLREVLALDPHQLEARRLLARLEKSEGSVS